MDYSSSCIQTLASPSIHGEAKDDPLRHHPPRILRLSEVCHYTGLSRTTVYQKLNPHGPSFDKEFPQRIRLQGTSCVGFLASEVAHWIDLQIARRKALMGVKHA